MIKTTVTTGTATLVVFDPACLRHRLSEKPDWWSLPREELREVNSGNALFLGLGSDGNYEIQIVHVLESRFSVEALLRNVSGRLFVGAAEYVTGGDLEPVEEYGNLFLSRPAGVYSCRALLEGTIVTMSLCQQPDVDAANTFHDSVLLTVG